MNYIDSITSEYQSAKSIDATLSAGMVGHALNLRYAPIVQEVFEHHVDSLNLKSTSPEQKRLATTRIAGSIATRFALASLFTSKEKPFADLRDIQQADVLNELMINYTSQKNSFDSSGQNPDMTLNIMADPMQMMTNQTW